MTEIAVRQENKNVISKMVDVVKPGYVKEACNMLEPLQKNGNKIVKSDSKFATLNKRMNARYKLIFAGFSTLTTPACASMLLSGVPDGVLTPGVIVVSAILSPVLGLISSALLTLIPAILATDKLPKKIATFYREDIKAWLYDEYKITTSEAELENIVSKIINPTEGYYLFTDTTSGYWHTLQLDSSGNNWIINKVNSGPANSIADVETGNNTDEPRIDAVLNTVNAKIDTLKKFTLTSEDDYLLSKAVNDTHATVKLVKQLQQLNDTEYVDKAENALQLVDTDLNAIIEHQKKEIVGQFRAQHNTILNRA